MSKRHLITIVTVLLLAGAAFPVSSPVSPAALAAEPRTSLPDIEDEVMCPTCGTPLNHAFSPQAERQRRFIRREIARGQTKDQIKDALVAEFGREVLATPDDEGFELTAYLVPAGGFLVAAIALGIGVSRWRRRPPIEPPAQPDISAADTARLEHDLSRYDP